MYVIKKNLESYDIIENNELIVNSYSSEEKAKRVCRGLNFGKGFDGFTPIFFTKRVDTSIQSC